MAASISSVSVAPQTPVRPHLGVGEDGAGHGRVGGLVDVGVAQALGVGEDRDAGLGLHALDQGAPAAGDDEVDEAARAEHGGDEGAARVRGGLDGVFRQPRGAKAGAQGGEDGGGGVGAVRASAQDDGVAGLEAQPGRIRADVGAALVDHADDADRCGDAAEVQAVRAGPFGQRAGERVGKGGDLLQARCHGFEAGRGEQETVLQRGAASEGGGVGFVGGEDGGSGGAQGGGLGQKPGVSGGVRRCGEDGRGIARPPSGIAEPCGAVVGFGVHPAGLCRVYGADARGMLRGGLGAGAACPAFGFEFVG